MMGLTSWPGEKQGRLPTKQDAQIAKNYLQDEEMETLNHYRRLPGIRGSHGEKPQADAHGAAQSAGRAAPTAHVRLQGADLSAFDQRNRPDRSRIDVARAQRRANYRYRESLQRNYAGRYRHRVR